MAAATITTTNTTITILLCIPDTIMLPWEYMVVYQYALVGRWYTPDSRWCDGVIRTCRGSSPRHDPQITTFSIAVQERRAGCIRYLIHTLMVVQST
jgi:hypothetical protein